MLPTQSILYNLYNELNSKFFNGTLPAAKITWDHLILNAGQCIITTDSKGKREYEIILSWKYHLLYEDELLATLKHEMLHIIYPEHDANFKREAERIGAYMFAKLVKIPAGRYKYKCKECGQQFFYDSINVLFYCPICLAVQGKKSILEFIGTRKWIFSLKREKLHIMPEQ